MIAACRGRQMGNMKFEAAKKIYMCVFVKMNDEVNF